MMHTKQTNPTSALQHVLSVVLGEQPRIPSILEGPYRKAFKAAGIQDINDLLAIDPMVDFNDVIISEVIPPPSPVKGTTAGSPGSVSGSVPYSARQTRQLSVVEKRMILQLQIWFREFSALNQAIPPMRRWFSLTPDVFENWRSTYDPNAVRKSGGTLPTGSNPVNSALENYQKGIKRDASEYKHLKEDKYWLNFRRQLLLTALTQGVGRIFDLTFDPKTLTGTDKTLYTEQNTFCYKVLNTIVQTSTGRTYIRQHTEDHDARAVFREMTAYYTTSRVADTAINTLRTTILEFRFDSSWTTGAVAFVNRWKTMVMDLDEVQEKPSDPDEKKRWITTALKPNTDMSQSLDNYDTIARQVSPLLQATSAGTTIATGKGMDEVTFGALMSHIETAAITFDESHKSARRVTRVAKQANSSKRGNFSKSTSNKSGFLTAEVWGKMTTVERSDFIKKRNESRKQFKSNATKAARQTEINQAIQEYIVSESASMTQVLPNRVPVTVPREINTTSVGTTQPSTPSGPVTLRSILMSKASVDQNSIATETTTVGADGHRYLRIDMAQRTYTVAHTATSPTGAMLDRGANGGLGGIDMKVLEFVSGVYADVQGVADASVTDLPIVLGASLVEQTNRGPIIGLFPQYAYLGKGRTIHSAVQMEAFGLDVDEKPRKARHPGQQRIVTPDGYVIPLSIRNGLPYMDMRYPTDADMKNYPHVYFTEDTDWNPAQLDDEYVDDPDGLDRGAYQSDIEGDELTFSSDVNDFGEFHSSDDRDLELLLTEVKQSRTVLEQMIAKHVPKFEQLRPNFGWISAERIKATLAVTTQFGRTVVRFPFRMHYKTRFPAANVDRLNDAVATDTFFADTPAVNDGIPGHGGVTMAQIFCARNTQLGLAVPMRSEKDMPRTLQEWIRTYGAPNMLISDNAKVEIGRAVQDILRYYAIKDHQSETQFQHQNYAERRIQELKRMLNTILDRTGAPPDTWLLCLLYITYLLNRLSVESLGGKSPIEAAYNQKPDVSPLLAFWWYQPVYYQHYEKGFPSQSKEKLGRWVGVAENKGDLMTFWIMDEQTRHVVARSNVRPVSVEDPNNRLASVGGEVGTMVSRKPIVMSTGDLCDNPPDAKLPQFTPDELLGISFLHKPEPDGETLRAHVVRKIEERDADAERNIVKFLITIGDNDYDEIITYNELCDIVEAQIEKEPILDDLPMGENPTVENVCKFQAIIGHDGPLKPSDHKHNGSMWNLLILWDDDTQTWEPLTIIAKDDPVSVADYGKANDLLSEPGWKRIRNIARKKKNLQRMLNQARIDPGRRVPKYKFGVQIPKGYSEVETLDKINGNTMWKDACQKEIDLLQEYKCFQDAGKYTPTPRGYQRIKLIWVFDVKQDLRRRARLVAGGHMTEPIKESSYSGVVSLRSFRICIFLGELNGLKISSADISSAYLEAYTQEKVVFTAGEEFGDLHGHTLMIVKALYGLRSSGKRFNERISDTLRDIGFWPSYADSEVWMREYNGHYEYVCLYVDDLAVMAENPSDIFQMLRDVGKYKLREEEGISYHIGGDFFRDPDGTLCYGAKTYIKRMLANYERMFGIMPKEYNAPLEAGDHPELDTSEFLDNDGIKKYQSLIGALQWAISLCRYDINCAVMTMGRFRTAPRKGHLERLKHIVGYLKKYDMGAIRFRTTEPDYSHLPEPNVDWTYAVYGKVTEQIPADIPKPLGKTVVLTCYVDANLVHDMVTGRSAMGILHMLNQTPVDSTSKRQDTVETATYGSEFIAARVATEQVMDLRNTIRYLGVPVEERTYMFGDNQSVVTSSTLPHSVLKKRHQLLAYHRVREAIASRILRFHHIAGTENPADVLTKNLSHSVAWPLIKPFLFWSGDMGNANL
jgi:hypothetical protein